MQEKTEPEGNGDTHIFKRKDRNTLRNLQKFAGSSVFLYEKMNQETNSGAAPYRSVGNNYSTLSGSAPYRVGDLVLWLCGK